MCKHVLNAKVGVRFPCCLKFYDCIDCHDDAGGHPAKHSVDLVFQCKNCDRCFRKDLRHFELADEVCPYCGTTFVLEAETPAALEAASGKPPPLPSASQSLASLP